MKWKKYKKTEIRGHMIIQSQFTTVTTKLPW